MGWIKAVESSPEYQQPAYAYQRAPYVYFNVSYVRTLDGARECGVDLPELGPLTTSLTPRPGQVEREALPAELGQAVSGWTTPKPKVALPLAFWS